MQIKRLCQQVGGLGAAMALLFCSFSAWAGDDHHRSDGDSPPPIATPTNVDALWIAESNGVIKVSTAAGRVILAIPDADKIESIAVDEPRTTLWAVGRGQLTAFGFDGRTLLSLPIPPQSSEHGDKKHDQESSSEHNDPASLAVDESDGSVWVGQGKAVYGVDATGQVISKIQQNRNVTALAVDGERGTVWVADERGVAAYGKDGALRMALPLGREDEAHPQDIAVDGQTGNLFVALKRSVVAFSPEGRVVASYPSRQPRLIAVDSGGNLWVAGESSLSRFDPSGMPLFELEPFGHSDHILALVTDPKDLSAWVANARKVAHVDATGRVTATVKSEGRVQDLALYIDTIPPDIAFTQPPANSWQRNNLLSLGVAYSDVGIGVDPDSIEFTVNGLPLPVHCDMGSMIGQCAPLTPLPEGPVTVAVTVKDKVGNESTPASLDFVVDTIPPAIAMVFPPTPYITNQPAILVAGSVSEWADLSVQGNAVTVGADLTFSAPAVLQENLNRIEVGASDKAGNASSQTLIVTLDTVPPVVTAPPRVTQEATGPLTAVAIGSATAIDLHDGVLIPWSDAPGAYPVGLTTVTWSAQDEAGNVGMAQQTVEVIDTTPPLVTPPADIRMEATGPRTLVALGKATATDLVAGALTPTSDAPVDFPVGTTVVTWSVSDTAGNTATAVQTITIVDTTPPKLVAPADKTVEARGPRTVVNLGKARARDVVDGVLTPTSDAPADFPVGTTTVTWSATDAAGNTGTATQTVTVVDMTPPTVTAPPAITLEATGPRTVVALGSATATDLVDGALTPASDAPTDFPVGTTVVTWSATDAAGNTGTATQIVTITDTTPPAVSAPVAITIEATGPRTPVALGSATATDLVDGTLTPASDAPTDFPVGTTVVTWSATDAAGNTGTATQTVTVVDTTPPIITAPAAITIEATGPRTLVDLGMTTATDLVDGALTPTSDAPTDFPVGTTTVTWSATDAAGNTGTATQTVTVLDTTPPTVTASAAITIEATGPRTVVALGSATATDLVDGALTPASDAPTDFPVGTTVVTWSATDAAGNTGTATQTVTVVDTTPPMVMAPANFTIEATGPLTAVAIGTGTASDLVYGALTPTSDTPADFPVGTTTVTWSATDAAGNTGTATQTVTVVDTTPPTVTAPANLTIEATGPLTAVAVGSATATDLVDGTLTPASDAPTDFPVGTTVVTWSATDAAGNTGTATQTVTVVDTTPPIITAPAAITIEATGPRTVVALETATATDLVDGPLTPTSDASTDFPMGITTVTWSGTDAAGNTGTATQTVTVVDTTPPTVTAPAAITIEATAPRTVVPLGSATATDLVDGALIPTSDAPADFPVGITTVTWSATDAVGNTGTATQTVTVADTTPPTLTVPSNVSVEASSPLSPVALGTAVAVDLADGVIAAVNNAPPGFPVGTTIVAWRATDRAGNFVTGMQTVTVVDTTPPTVMAPSDLVVEATALRTATFLGTAAATDLASGVLTAVSDAPSHFPLGTTVVTWSATDAAGYTAQATQKVTVQDTTAPSLQVPADVSLVVHNNAPTPVSLGQPTASDIFSPVGTLSDAPALFPVGTTAVVWTATDPNGNQTTATQNVRVTYEHIVTPAETNLSPTSYGHRYRAFIPGDVTLTQYDEPRFSLIKGNVVDTAGRPLPRARVSVLNHPEYGSALSDGNGGYVLPVEGGARLTVEIQSERSLLVQRSVETLWNQIHVVDPVMLLEKDSKGTTIALDGNPASSFVHQSTPTVDAAGRRSATLVFAGDTTAQVVSADGTTVPLTGPLTVRATEYAKPETMPGNLPPTSQYTYCVNLSIDGVPEKAKVLFNRKVMIFVDNFLNYPIGEIVPIGYYNPTTGFWEAQDNGVVVQLLDLNGDGVVDALDATGDGNADDLDGNGSFANEVGGLVGQSAYRPGNQYWMFGTSHFSDLDANSSSQKEGDETADDASDSRDSNEEEKAKDKVNKKEDDPCVHSRVGLESGVFSEHLEIPGTDLGITYRSSRVPGKKIKIHIPATGNYLSPGLVEERVTVTVAGQTFNATLPPQQNQSVDFLWDGTDFDGLRVQGHTKAHVVVKYGFPTKYTPAIDNGGPAWAGYGDANTVIATRPDVLTWAIKVYWMDLVVPPSSGQIADGWELDDYHQLVGDSVFLGSGGKLPRPQRIIQSIAGGSTWGFSGDGGPAKQALLDTPKSARMAPDGNFFIVDTWNSRIRKIDRNGIITTVAGTGAFAYSGDGGPAINAALRRPQDLDFGPDGSIYIADTENHTIRKIDSNGIITTIAGTGSWGYLGGDGGPATATPLRWPGSLSVGPDGSIYFVDTFNHAVRRVSPDGIINTIMGTGSRGKAVDGAIAKDSPLNEPWGIDVGPDGSVYVTDDLNEQVLKISVDGIVHVIAGTGVWGYSGDGGPATKAQVDSPESIEVAPDGSVYFGDFWNHSVRKISPDGIISTVAGNFQRGFSGDGGTATQGQLSKPESVDITPSGDLLIADSGNDHIRIVPLSYSDATTNAAGQQQVRDVQRGLIYVFDAEGTHIETRDLITQKIITTFQHDSAGKLTAIVDRFGNTTRFEQGPSGLAAIVGPDSMVTQFNVANDQLLGMSFQNGTNYAFTYSNDSLLLSKQNPNGGQSSYEYNEAGEVVYATNTAGGIHQFERHIEGNELIATMTDPEGRTSTAIRTTNSDGTSVLTMVDAAGNRDVFEALDGSTKTRETRGNGLVSEVQYGIDPLFGGVYPQGATYTLPSGLSLATSVDVNYTDSNRDGIPEAVSYQTQRNGITWSKNVDLAAGTVDLVAPSSQYAAQHLRKTFDPNTMLLRSVLIPEVPGIASIDYGYDPRGRLQTITQGDRQSTLSYGTDGFLAAITNPLGQTVRYERDTVGRLTLQTLTDGRSVAYRYDGNGNLISLTPPGRSEHRFEYTALDQRSSYTPPDVGFLPATRYHYNLAKQLTQIDRPDGQSLILQYDVAGRLSGLLLPDAILAITYGASTCASCGNHAAPAQIVRNEASGAIQVLDFQYDGPAKTGEVSSGQINGTVSFGLDSNLRLGSISAGGQTTAYRYNEDGALLQAGDLLLTRQDYTGNLVGTALGQVATTQGYNRYNEVASFAAVGAGTNLLSDTYVRDALGRIVQKSETIQGSTTTYDYGYDVAGRLSEVKENGTVVASYQYDANGNRIGGADRFGPITATVDAQDRLLDYAGNAYTYTANGELQTKTDSAGTTTYTYDLLGNLTEVVLPNGKVIEYIIDGRNRRVGKKVDGVLTQGFLYQDQLNPVAELDGAGNVVSLFVYGSKANVPDYLVRGGVTYRIVSDHLGSPRLVVNAADGTVVQRIDYDEWGNVRFDSNPGFQPFGFAGGIADNDTGLIRFGARDYDPQTGRWTAKDPILFEGGDGNLYGYVLRNPINFIDPLGLWGYATEYSTTGEGLTGDITIIEGAVDQVYQDVSGTTSDATVTYSTNGEHTSPASKHYTGEAVDLRTRDLTTNTQKVEFKEQLQDLLGSDYDVILEPDHIHLEYDPDIKTLKPDKPLKIRCP